MKKNQNKNNTKRYDKLTKNSVAEDYCKTLEEMYTDVVSIPMFNDGDVHIDDWGIGFFHKESQIEIAWTIIMCMMTFINNTGHEVSHCLQNEDFKFYAQVQERTCLGQSSTLYKDDFGFSRMVEIAFDDLDES